MMVVPQQVYDVDGACDGVDAGRAQRRVPILLRQPSDLEQDRPLRPLLCDWTELHLLHHRKLRATGPFHF